MVKLLAIGVLLAAPTIAAAASTPEARASGSNPASGSNSAAGPVSVLIVHDSISAGDHSGQWLIPALVNLLGHFDCRIGRVESEAYRAGQMGGYDAVLYVGLRPGERLPEALLRDIYHATKPVCWLGGNLDQLAERFSLQRYGFELSAPPVEEGFRRLTYRGLALARPATPLISIKVTRPASCEVLAAAEDGGDSLPYVVRAGKFWYFPGFPLWEFAADGCDLVLCDQLHSILGRRHRASRKALFCIAGVNAGTDSGSLRKVTNLLLGERIPFAISVTPVFRDPEAGVEVRLSKERGLVGVLREAQRGGAAVIAHGLTHQAFGRSGEDAEFWDLRRDLPLAGRSAATTGGRIEKAVGELAICGLFPVAWATPAGWASPTAYREIARHWGTVWETRVPSESAPAPQVFPFVIRRDSYGQHIIPDNLRPLHSVGEVERILEQVHHHSLVPDPWVTAEIAPDAAREAVSLLVSELREMGYRFVDLRQSANWVKTGRLCIYSEGEARAISELLPKGWDGALLGPGPKDLVRFEQAGRDGRAAAVMEPGAILITYPSGGRPREVFALEGGPEAAAQRAVMRIATIAIIVGVLLVGIFVLIYVLQFFLRRA